jgi:hypothetical protein
VIWGTDVALVREWTDEQLRVLGWLATFDQLKISPCLFEILEMEVVLTRIGAGIMDEDGWRGYSAI